MPAKLMNKRQIQIHNLGDLDPVVFIDSMFCWSFSDLSLLLLRIQPTNSMMDTMRQMKSERNVFTISPNSMFLGSTEMPNPKNSVLSNLTEPS